MTIGSLFSGIGGLELGLEWAGLGPVIWQVEKNEKRRNSLGEHWPDARRFEDVCAVGSDQLKPVDLICGGFPCQDVSSAGKRTGLRGARSGLWFQMARIIEDLRPRWVVVENVSSGARTWVDSVRDSLGELGYASFPIPLSAANCGAWHRRTRIFIVAYSDPKSGKWRQPESSGWPLREFSYETPADSNGDALREQSRRGGGKDGLRPSLPRQHCGWSVEPEMVRVVHGLPGRMDRISALGDSVVPQCAEVIGEVIKLLESR